MSAELAMVTAEGLARYYDGDVNEWDFLKRFSRRSQEHPTLLSSVLCTDGFLNDVYSLTVVDLTLDRHLLPPIDWLSQTNREVSRELGDRGLTLFEAHLQRLVTDRREDINYDQWMPRTLNSQGVIIERMLAK